MRWIPIVCLLLAVPGCVDPVVPDELKAVLDDPSFSEVPDVTHQGDLDSLEGCWGSYWVTTDETSGERTSDAMFMRFGEDGTWTNMALITALGLTFVVVEGGTFTVLDENTVGVVIETTLATAPYTGELVSADEGGGRTREHELKLEGDAMAIVVPDTDTDAETPYDVAFRRFETCP